jgi:hypothetical protein
MLSTMSRCAYSFFSDTISHIFKPIHPQMIQLGKHLPILQIWRVASINWGFVGHKNEMQFYVGMHIDGRHIYLNIKLTRSRTMQLVFIHVIFHLINNTNFLLSFIEIKKNTSGVIDVYSICIH